MEAEPSPSFLVEELAASTVNLIAYFWVNSRRTNFLEATAQVTHTIKEALEAASIEMPTEIYTLVFRHQHSLTSEAVQANGAQINNASAQKASA